MIPVEKPRPTITLQSFRSTRAPLLYRSLQQVIWDTNESASGIYRSLIPLVIVSRDNQIRSLDHH